MRVAPKLIIGRFQKHRPIDAIEVLLKCRVTLRFLADGAFRDVYKMVGTPFVLKCPKYNTEYMTDGIEHAAVEINAWRRVKRDDKYLPIRPLLPVVHYANRNTGIIVMDEYNPLKHARFDKIISGVSDFLYTLGYADADVNIDKPDNWGVTTEGKLVMLDLGCLAREPLL